jgi:AbrB family looped-hinge helix DNA binding protein
MSLEKLRISSNGQVSIPAHIRRRWGATDVLVIDKGDRIIVRPVPIDPIAAVVGKYADSVPPSEELRRQARDEVAEEDDGPR